MRLYSADPFLDLAIMANFIVSIIREFSPRESYHDR